MTESTSLALRRLQVRRAPGIPDSFVVDGLSDRVNVIHGPNGSGKTTTSTTIEALLWPGVQKGGRIGASARYVFEGSDFVVDLDAGHLSVQRDGKPGRAPDLPAPELRQRYRLSLHELLVGSESGSQFAKEILRQSEGGYDFVAAARRLRFSAKPSSASTELDRLKHAREKVREATSRQAALHEEGARLELVERARDEAAPAARRVQLLEAAIAHATARHRAAETKAAMEALPAQLAGMYGNEAQRLETALAQRVRIDGDLEAEHAKAIRAERQAGEELPGGPLPGELLSSAQADRESLAQAEATLLEAERRVSEHRAQLETARRTLGATVTDEQLASLTVERFEDLVALAHRAEGLNAELAAVDGELRRLDDAVAPGDLDVLRDGIRVLSRWLQATPGQAAGGIAGSRVALVWLLAVIAIVLSIGLATAWHVAAAAGAIVAVFVAFLATRQPRAGPDEREVYRAQYLTLGLDTPSAWEAAAVASQLDALTRKLAEDRVREFRHGWRNEATLRRQQVGERMEALERERQAVAGRLGLAPDADARKLAYLVEGISRWQRAWQGHEGARSAHEHARDQRDAARARAGARLAAYGSPPLPTSQDVVGVLANLVERQQRHQAAVDAKAAAEQRQEQLRRERAAVDSEIAGLCAVAYMEEPDLDAMRHLCAQHGSYEQALTACRLADGELASARQRLEQAEGFESPLLQQPVETLEALRAEAARMAEEYRALVEEAARLHARVETAKQESNVEQALAEVTEAEERLRERRAADLRAAIGEALLTHVQRVSRDEHRPPVFNRARELFAQVTRGRYVLEFEEEGDDGTPCFRARDSRTGVGHALEELSSATRVQLLLAVRIAFVEAQEHGVRLPLLLDETLGTTDDVRAEAIIDAVITLAEGGRQVFYFTARSDEVERWKAALATRGATYAIIDLAEKRALGDETSRRLKMPVPIRRPMLPALGDHTHASYSAELQLPLVRAGVDSVWATHLWYLVEDLPALYHLLSLGVSTWGELETLLAHGGELILAEFPGVLDRVRALAGVVAVMHEEAAIGRGRLLDRGVLLESDAVSDKKIDEVAEVAARCGWRPLDLLAALDAGDVRGFQTKKIQDLRKYLEENEYLDPRPVRTGEQIRVAMLGAAMSAISDGVLAPDAVDTLLERIGERAEREPADGEASASGIAPDAGMVAAPE